MLAALRPPEQVRRIVERELEQFLLSGDALGLTVLPVLVRDIDRQPDMRGTGALAFMSTLLRAKGTD